MQEPVELKSLVYDNTSGAREIAQRTLVFLQRTAMTSTATTPSALLDELAQTGAKIVRSKPEMAQVFQAINRFLLDAEAEEPAGGEVGPHRIAVVSLLNRHVQRLATDLAQVAEHAQALFPNGSVVLSHSRSSTVLQALKRAKQEGRQVDVIVSESRPMLEGRQLARELAEDQIPVRFVVDALLATAVRGCDRVVLGADAVTPQGIVNKAGTHLAVLAAKDAGVPVHVLAETSKAWVKKVDPNLGLLHGRLRDPKEVWDHPPYGIEVVNLYFELTPLFHVESIVCEEGQVSPSDYWVRIRTRGYSRRLQEAFADEVI